MYQTSNLYIVCVLEAQTTDIHMDPKEISDCKWMTVPVGACGSTDVAVVRIGPEIAAVVVAVAEGCGGSLETFPAVPV